MRFTDTTVKLAVPALLAAGWLCQGRQTWAQQTSTKVDATKSYEFDVPGTKVWVDTNIDLRGGTKLRGIPGD